MRDIHTIVVHYLLTRTDWPDQFETYEEAVEEVRRWHVEARGWDDVGYHRIIFPAGEVLDGRPIERVGAGVAGRNSGKVHIAYVGGIDEWGVQGADTRTPEQAEAIHREIDRMQEEFGPDLRVVGHRDLAATECPGYDAGAAYAEWSDHRSIPEPELEPVRLPHRPLAELEAGQVRPIHLRQEAEADGVDREAFRIASRVIARYLHGLIEQTPWYRRASTVIRAVRDLLREV